MGAWRQGKYKEPMSPWLNPSFRQPPAGRYLCSNRTPTNLCELRRSDIMPVIGLLRPATSATFYLESSFLPGV